MKIVVRMGVVLLGLVAIAGIAAVVFLNRPQFGRLPRGERKERIERSPNFRDGEFRNRQVTVMMASKGEWWRTVWKFLFREDAAGVRPTEPMEVTRTDLKALDANQELLVWFGHSSYLVQTAGRRILVDPVFCRAAPVSFVNRPFAATDAYAPEDMPRIDYLVITHDHWDHLDYETVVRLRERVGRVVCPLGVGEHFEYWGFEPERIVELDWDEEAMTEEGFRVVCLPTRHFSGRGLRRNRTLWASFLIDSPKQRIYIGGDGGYDDRFAEIGRRFPGITLAMLENGQYNEAWRYIHTMPEYLGRAARELGAERIVTVHHSKYALARHAWDEPLEHARRLAERDSLPVVLPGIGVVVRLGN